jgi:hypothetical protein
MVRVPQPMNETTSNSKGQLKKKLQRHRSIRTEETVSLSHKMR